MQFSDDFEIRFEFECVEDKFSSGYLDLSDLLKNNKFTFGQFADFNEEEKNKNEELDKDMYTIGDEIDSGDDAEEIAVAQLKGSDQPELVENGSDHKDSIDSDDEFDDDLDDEDDEEYIKKLEEQA
jgi:hypothetical protein